MCNVTTLELAQRLLACLGDPDSYDTLRLTDLVGRVLAFKNDDVVKALREIGFDIVYDTEARERWLRNHEDPESICDEPKYRIAEIPTNFTLMEIRPDGKILLGKNGIPLEVVLEGLKNAVAAIEMLRDCYSPKGYLS